MESKKAQNLSITTIILIILGVVVLVVLIIGFTKGWGSVKEFFTGGESDFQKISSQCSIACATMDEISWCQNRTLEGVSGKCKYFANKYTSIEGCPEIVCPTDTEALKCVDHLEYVDLCTEQETCDDPIQGMFSDTAGGKVCCKVACT